MRIAPRDDGGSDKRQLRRSALGRGRARTATKRTEFGEVTGEITVVGILHPLGGIRRLLRTAADRLPRGRGLRRAG